MIGGNGGVDEVWGIDDNEVADCAGDVMPVDDEMKGGCSGDDADVAIGTGEWMTGDGVGSCGDR